MDPTEFEKQRRAVRITPPTDVKILLTRDGDVVSNVKILDMSTLGMGLQVSFAPGETRKIKIQFQSPQILSGLVIEAHVCNHRQLQNADGSASYILGVEYIFSSPEQQNMLLRWMTTFFHDQLRETQGAQSPALPQRPIASPIGQYAFKPEAIYVHLPQNESELEQSFFLLQPLNIYNALLQTKYLLAYTQGTIAAVVPLVLDTLQFKLPADQYFPDYLNGLRAQNRKLGEIPTQRFNENAPAFQSQHAVILKKLNLLYTVFLHVIVYAKNFAQLTDLVAFVPPTLQEFYRLWFFKDLRDEVDLKSVTSQTGFEGFRFMSLDLKSLPERLRDRRPELLEKIKSVEDSPQALQGFQMSFYPNHEFIERWFVQKRNFLQELNTDQKKYFTQLVPELHI